MWKRIWAITQKEFIHTLRDRSSLALLLTLPLLQLFLFGFAIDVNITHIPMVVADQSHDSASRAFIAAMQNSGYFDVTMYVPGEAEATRAIDAGAASVALIIPTDFAALVERGQAQTLMLIDGSDLFMTMAAFNVASVIAQAHASEVLMQRVARSGLPVSGALPLDTRTRILYNPDQAQLWFVVPSMTALLLQTSAVTLTALAVVREREAGTMEQLLVTPIRPLELMLGKMAPNLVIAMLNMLTVIAAGVFIFKVPFRGSFALFYGLSLLYVFSGLGLGLFISTISKNLKQAQQFIAVVVMIGTVLGGFLFPRYSMPLLLRWVGNLFPMTYFIPIARGIITKGVGLDSLWRSVVALALYSIGIMVLAARLFRQRL